MKKKNTRKGFTLVELLVVIAILAILASVCVIGYTQFIAKARIASDQAELDQVVQYITAGVLGDEHGCFDELGMKLEGNVLKISGTEADITAYFNSLKTSNHDFAHLEGTFSLKNDTTLHYTGVSDDGVDTHDTIWDSVQYTTTTP